MRPVHVVVGHVLGQDALQMASTEDENSVETLTTDRADETFGEGISPWRPDRRADDPDALSPEYLIEARSELGVSVTDQELDWMRPVAQHQAQIAGFVGQPTPQSDVP